MLIKVDVDPEIVYNHAKAHTYAQNHCDRLEYELVDYLYPNEEYTPKGKVGELPQYVEDYAKRRVVNSTGHADDRWYDWRVQNWDTKWAAYAVVVIDDDPDSTEIEFNTAWAPPEAICHKLREDYPDIAISWFYDEPGCEIAGYL